MFNNDKKGQKNKVAKFPIAERSDSVIQSSKTNKINRY